ncbi:MAG: asparagine synthase (glutamine-hydrolyzing) [Nitrospinaceae bacterium]
MCGIAGIFQLNGASIDPDTLEKMTQSAAHRGPDGFGYTVLSTRSGSSLTLHNQNLDPRKTPLPEGSNDLGLGHRRLAIIDLTDAANQPMTDASRDLWIVYNGEIYNYLELAEELREKGHIFSSASDTEVVLRAYGQWGVDCLEKLEGMFAFAIWDQGKRRLFCGRDRFGMKPFYFFYNRETFVFGSEIKQLFHFNGVPREVNPPLVYDYLMHGFTDHSSQTLFKNIRQLEPGCYLTVSAENRSHPPEPKSYWQLKETEVPSLAGKGHEERFREIFLTSVRNHLRSDVRVGSCLSGGIDSASIVCSVNAILKEQGFSTPHQWTFTSCFREKNFDEREYADAVIEATGAKHHQLFPDMNRAMEEVSRMLAFHDEPFGSTSQYAQWCLFREIQKSGTKVVLDGQGADEILSGYHNTYGAFFLELFQQGRWGNLLKEIRQCRELHSYTNGNILKFIASSLAIDWFGMRLGFLRPRPSWMGEDFYRAAKRSLAGQTERFSRMPHANFLHHLIRFNLSALLRFEDRSSMAHSVEARLPFLDHHLAEFLFSLPADLKIHNGWTKAILRQAMKNRIPEKIRRRKDKMGFVTPERLWMQSIPQKVIDDLFSSPAVRDSGYFNAEAARRKFLSIARGEAPFNFLPWRMLNFCLWLETLNRSG